MQGHKEITNLDAKSPWNFVLSVESCVFYQKRTKWLAWKKNWIEKEFNLNENWVKIEAKLNLDLSKTESKIQIESTLEQNRAKVELKWF